MLCALQRYFCVSRRQTGLYINDMIYHIYLKGVKCSEYHPSDSRKDGIMAGHITGESPIQREPGIANLMSSHKQVLAHAEAQCADKGTKLTQKRKTVLQGLLQTQQAMSAYELADYCRDELGESMPPMSVYRILEFLEGEQLVHKLKLANRFVACVHITCDHKHAVPQFLICEQCHRVSEVSIKESTLRALRNNVETAGFKLASPQIELNCVCDTCAVAG